MSAANRLVMHHTYDRGIAFDVSEYGNHGHMEGVVPGTGASAGSLSWVGRDSIVRVPPSPSLRDMRAIRIRVRVRLTSQLNSLQQTLIWAPRSFGLAISGLDLSVNGWIMDGTFNWRGPSSPPGVITRNQWHVIEYHHDGISHAWIEVDGTKVAEVFDVPGPIRDVDAEGIGIGHWPDNDLPFGTLEGFIDDIRLWTSDPKDDIRRLIDDCCIDRAGLDEMLARIHTSGYTASQLQSLVHDIFGLGTEVAAAARGGDPARTQRASQLTRDAMFALMSKDRDAFASSSGALESFLREQLSDADLLAFGTRAVTQLQALPFGGLFQGPTYAMLEAALLRYARLLCMDDLVPERPEKPEKPGEPHRPDRPEGGPTTDGADGKPPDGWEIGGEDSNPDDGGSPPPDGWPGDRPDDEKPPADDEPEEKPGDEKPAEPGGRRSRTTGETDDVA